MFTTPLDLAPITRFLRAKASSHLLVAAVMHLCVFEELCEEPKSKAELQQKLGLKDRHSMVLIPALLAMGLIEFNQEEKLRVTEIGKYLTKKCPSNLLGYVGLEKQDQGVLQMVEWLLNDGPKNASAGF